MIPTRRRLLTGALATASVLAAPAIVKAQTARRSIDSFGDGATQRNKSEATADWRACFNAAANSGSPVEVPPGRYPFRTFTNTTKSVFVNAAVPIDFLCSPNASLIAGSQLSGQAGALFYFRNPNGPTQDTSATFRFVGGFFDGSQLTSVSSGGFGLTMLDVYQYASPSFIGVSGDGGYSAPSTDPQVDRRSAGWGDTLLTTHNCFKEQIINLFGSGFLDCALYLSGDNGDDSLNGVGEQAFVRGLVATRCGNGIALKRDYVGATIQDCAIYYCGNGILSGAADGGPDNQGKRTRISGGQIGRIQGRPILIYGSNPIVENVTIGEFGLKLADNRTPESTRSGNEISAIDVRGGTGGYVKNNTITTRTIARDPRTGIALRKDTNGKVTSGCTVSGNDITGPGQLIFLEPGSENNTIGSNP